MTMSSKEKEEEAPSAAFSLNTQSSSFASRTNDVFANLGTLEKKHSAFVKTQVSTDNEGILKADPDEDIDDRQLADCRGSRSTDMHFRSSLSDTRDQDVERRSRSLSDDRSGLRGCGSRGGFRPPRGAPPRPKRVPDYKKHPDRWTCYSLEDVPDQDMSNRTNTKAALEFLEKRRKEQDRQERVDAGLPEEEEKFDVSSGACSQGAIVFTRKKKSEDSSSENRGGGKSKDKVSSKADSLVSVRKEQDIVCEDKDETSVAQDGDKPEGFKFKSKKTVKRSIRRKDNNSDDSDG